MYHVIHTRQKVSLMNSAQIKILWFCDRSTAYGTDFECNFSVYRIFWSDFDSTENSVQLGPPVSTGFGSNCGPFPLTCAILAQNRIGHLY